MEEKEITIGQLLTAKPKETIELILKGGKDIEKIAEFREEFRQLRRNVRDTQVDKTQGDKTTVANKKIKKARIPVPFQVKIVETATAFEVGEGTTLSPNEDNDLAKEIKRLWRTNRVDFKLIELILAMKSETEAAITFYIDDLKPNTLFNRLLGINKNKEIKSTVLTSKGGQMAPYFDASGDMKAFLWKYQSVGAGEKKINHVWVYDELNCYKLSDITGEMVIDTQTAHGFGKIPVVYLSQDYPEWENVKLLIDRFETALSKLADSNDYTGHPFLILYGEVVSMPKKDDNGKVLRFPVKVDQDGKEHKGDAKFLTNDNGPASVKLELDKLEKLINYLTNTPQMSLEDLKGMGAISGVAIKLMFLDAIIKAKLREGGNRTTVERILNILIAGTVNTTVTKYKKLAENTFFDIAFRSIIPNDIKETIEYLAQGVEAGFISRKTAVTTAGLTEDPDAEIKEIDAGKAAAAALAPDLTPGSKEDPPGDDPKPDPIK